MLFLAVFTVADSHSCISSVYNSLIPIFSSKVLYSSFRSATNVSASSNVFTFDFSSPSKVIAYNL